MGTEELGDLGGVETADDQNGATLATWFGVQPGNLHTVFPNIGNFKTVDLGFLK